MLFQLFALTTLLSTVSQTVEAGDFKFAAAEISAAAVDLNQERLTMIYDQRLDDGETEIANAERMKPKKADRDNLVENIRNKSCALKLTAPAEPEKLFTAQRTQYQLAALHLIAVDRALDHENAKPYVREIQEFSKKTILEIDRHLSALLTYTPSHEFLEQELIAAVSGYFLPLLRSEYILNSGYSEMLIDRFTRAAETIPSNAEVLTAASYAAGIAREDKNAFDQVKKLIKKIRKSLETGPEDSERIRSAHLHLLGDYLAAEVVGPLNFNPLDTPEQIAEFMRAVDLAEAAGMLPQEYLTGHALSIVERQNYLRKSSN